MPGKKKATGLSKRQSFLDRNVIAENKEILRFNEALVDEARGVQRSRGPAEDGNRGRARERPTRPARPSRPSRPRLPPDQETALRTAVAAASDLAGVEAAGLRLVDSLGRGDRFERASEAGWRVLVDDPTAAERSSQEWDQLRSAWAAVRRAALAEWVTNHPEAADLLEKEAKAAARAERAATRRPAARRTGARRPRTRPPVELTEGGAAPGTETSASAAEAGPPAEGSDVGADEKRRRPRRRRPRRGDNRPDVAEAPAESPAEEVPPGVEVAPAEAAGPAEPPADSAAPAEPPGESASPAEPPAESPAPVEPPAQLDAAASPAAAELPPVGDPGIEHESAERQAAGVHRGSALPPGSSEAGPDLGA